MPGAPTRARARERTLSRMDLPAPAWSFTLLLLYYTVLYCTVLYCTILYCTILYCTILYYTTLYYTILYYSICYVMLCYVMLCYVMLSYVMLCYIISHHIILYYIISYYIILQFANARGRRRTSDPASSLPWSVAAALHPASSALASSIHPVSITRFLLRIFSPAAGLLRNPFVHR